MLTIKNIISVKILNVRSFALIWISGIFWCISVKAQTSQELRVFSEIPGRTPSDKYECKVRQVGTSTWQNAFVLQTKSKPEDKTANNGKGNGYKDNLKNWSASWIAFEFSGMSVEVEISKVGGGAISKAMVRPVGHASDAKIENGKVYVTFDKPANINVDIDGQMEDNYTGMGYAGSPVHTISLFANPLFTIPTKTNPRVKLINPGEAIPAGSSAWDTVYFMPGVHNIGAAYKIISNKVLYIPGNAVVHGSIHPPDLWGKDLATNWSVYGSGTLSLEDFLWNGDGIKENKAFTYQASGVRLEGFVVADPANHTFNMYNPGDEPQQANIYNNLKVLGWRINGDAINAFNNSIITNCFFRTQDDVFYYGGNNVKISNCVTWNDYNGAVLYVTKGAATFDESYFKDIKVIYHRAGWHYWSGGRAISFRDRKPGDVIQNVQIKNVLVEDPKPAFPPFYLIMNNPNNSSAPVDFYNISIEGVVQKYPAVIGSLDGSQGKPCNTMLGLDANRKFSNITFKNCYYNGKWLSSFEDGSFLKNDFVFNINFILNADISVTANNPMGGTVSGGGFYKPGDEITILASPKTGYKFTGWSVNGKTVSTDAQYTFTVGSSDTYVANFVLISGTVITSEIPFSVCVNPASDMLLINSNGMKINQVQLIDLTGKVIFTSNKSSQCENIDLNGFKPGMYLVKIQYSGKVISKKITIN